jgi:hypothetical protein
MSKEPEFFIWTICFDTSTTAEHCHVLMIPVVPGEPGDELRKPLTNQSGRIVNPAPKWFLKAKQEAHPE